MSKHQYYLNLAYEWEQTNQYVCDLEDLCVDEPEMASIWREELEREYVTREMLEQELSKDAGWAQWLEGKIKSELLTRHSDRLFNFIAGKHEL